MKSKKTEVVAPSSAKEQAYPLTKPLFSPSLSRLGRKQGRQNSLGWAAKAGKAELSLSRLMAARTGLSLSLGWKQRQQKESEEYTPSAGRQGGKTTLSAGWTTGKAGGSLSVDGSKEGK